MHRFFINQQNIFNNTITIDGEDVQHISKVLRLREGDMITLCDQNGTDYHARIDSISKSTVEAAIVESEASKGEAKVRVVLYQGIPKATKMDLIIQKCTEMGISRIVPISTARTVVKLETEKDERKKVERWSKIAEEAAKQSKRGIVPIIEMPMTLKEAFKDAKDSDIKVIPYELENSKSLKLSLTDVKTSKESIGSAAIFIGPEGGFDTAEVKAAMDSGIVPVTLGSRILRTETAGFTALTCIMYEFNELG